MSVTIDWNGTEATCTDGKWTSRDKGLVRKLDEWGRILKVPVHVPDQDFAFVSMLIEVVPFVKVLHHDEQVSKIDPDVVY